jgi:hypothetical protein
MHDLDDMRARQPMDLDHIIHPHKRGRAQCGKLVQFHPRYVPEIEVFSSS